MDNITDILRERGARYGVFMQQAQIAQSIHLVLEQSMQLSGKTRFSFTPDQLEAMNMIVNKISRIYNGDPDYADSWRDIAGYATLVADRLDDNTAKQKLVQKLVEGESERDQTDTTVDSTVGGSPIRLEVQDGNHTSSSPQV